MVRLLLGFAFLLISTNSNSQNQIIDSLQLLLKSNNEDCSIYNDVSWEYVRINSDSSLHYNQKYLDCATKKDIAEREYIFINRIGNNKLILSELDSAIYYFSLAKSKIPPNDPEFNKKVLGIKNNLSNVYLFQGKFAEAKNGFKECLKISHTNNDTASIIKFNINLGASFQMEGVLDTASLFLLNALDLSEEIDSDKFDSFIHNNLCAIFSDLAEHEKSIYYCDLIIKSSTSQKQILATAYNTKSNGLIQLGKYDEAEDLLNKAIDLVEIPITNYHTYYSMSDLNINKQNYDQAIQNLLKAKKTVQNTELYLEIAAVEAKLAECYTFLKKFSLAELSSQNAIDIFQKIDSKTKTYLRALELNNESKINQGKKLNNENYSKERILRDSFNSVTILNNANELEQRYQSEKKETQNQILLKEQKLNKSIIDKQKSFLLAFAIALLSFLFLIWNQWHRAKERKLHVQELQSKNKSIQTLNKEINHRTKNHLALATALLTKHKSKSQNKVVKAAITENENSLRALVLVNQKLTNSNNQIEIQLYDYLKDLCDDLIFSLKLHSSFKDVKLKLDCPNIKIDSEICLRIGLIANELITNSFKHSIVDEEILKLGLDIKMKGNEFTYEYIDNGTNAKEVPNSQQGLQLIKELVGQLNGKYKIAFDRNFSFEAEFSK